MMYKKIVFVSTLIFIAFSVFSQQNPLSRLDKLIGHWEGTGEGFGNAKSEITTDYSWMMDKLYIKVKNRSKFDPTPENPEGEIHEDFGIISFNNQRSTIIFRQYHNEGYFTEYALNDSISTPQQLVFETERIENFVPGSRARFSIKILNEDEIESLFYVGFPRKEMACLGTNHLRKK